MYGRKWAVFFDSQLSPAAVIRTGVRSVIALTATLAPAQIAHSSFNQRLKHENQLC